MNEVQAIAPTYNDKTTKMIIQTDYCRLFIDSRVMPVLFALAMTPPLLAQTGDSAEAIELQGIIVEQQGEEPLPELPLGTGISGETLRRIPGAGGDPLRGLQSLPGLNFADDSEAEPAVRGSRPGDNYVQADFLPVGYLFHAGGVISVFNADLIEAFNIYPSAYGPEFSGFTGAAIDVQLRDPKTDRLHTTFDASFLQAGLLVEGPVADGQSFYLAGRMSYLDLLVADQLDEEDGITFEQFPKYTDYQGKYVWKLAEDSTLRLQLNGATDKQEITVDEDSEEIDNDPIFAGRIYDSRNFNEQGLVWEQRAGRGISIKSALAHSNFSGQAQAGGAGQADIETEGWSLKSHARLPLNERHEIGLGGRLSRLNADLDIAFNAPACTEFEPDCSFTDAERLTTTQSLTINSAELFIKDNWYASDRLTLFPSLVWQSEDYLNKQFLEPRFSLEYSFSDDLILSAGTGLYHQMPEFEQVDEVFGNPELDYIESLHGVIGIQKFLDDGWEIKTELYYKKLDKLVTGSDASRYSNDGKGYAYGVDVLVRKDASEKLSGWLSLSLSKARREHKLTGDSFAFDYDQPVNATLVGKYRFSRKWSLGGKLWMHSGAPYTPVIGATPDEQISGLYNPQYAEVNSKRLPLYSRLDMRVDRTFRRVGHKQISAYLEVLNLLDARNVSGYDYNGDYSERKKVSQLPRIIALGIRAEF
ncbi:MAG: TonB-dependent receptor [Gammaproteobacteria bacterium]|nr:TonB-dependent receptor [Gammaproteobacteria bacterium]